MNDLELMFAILVILLPLLLFFSIKREIRSLKMTRKEVRKLLLFFLFAFVPIFLIMILILYLSSLLNLYYALIMVVIDMGIIVFPAGMSFYLAHVVDPRLKRDYGITLEYIRRQGLWKSLDQFEGYRKWSYNIEHVEIALKSSRNSNCLSGYSIGSSDFHLGKNLITILFRY